MGEAEALTLELGLPGDGDADGDSETEPLALELGDTDDDGDNEIDALALRLWLALAEADGETDALGDGVGDTLALGEISPVASMKYPMNDICSSGYTRTIGSSILRCAFSRRC